LEKQDTEKSDTGYLMLDTGVKMKTEVSRLRVASFAGRLEKRN
jgi:hypothetical protein